MTRQTIQSGCTPGVGRRGSGLAVHIAFLVLDTKANMPQLCEVFILEVALLVLDLHHTAQLLLYAKYALTACLYGNPSISSVI